MDIFNRPLGVVIGIGIIIFCFVIGYKQGVRTGYQHAQDDIKATQAAAAHKAAEQAAKSINPFQQANPLDSVKSNPFADAKKVLNPF